MNWVGQVYINARKLANGTKFLEMKKWTDAGFYTCLQVLAHRYDGCLTIETQSKGYTRSTTGPLTTIRQHCDAAGVWHFIPKVSQNTQVN